MKKILLSLVLIASSVCSYAAGLVTPEGTPSLYELSYKVNLASGISCQLQGLAINISYSEDGKSVYFSNLFPLYEDIFKVDSKATTWVKGDLEGDVVTIQPQCILQKTAMTGNSYFWVGKQPQGDAAGQKLLPYTFSLKSDGRLVGGEDDNLIIAYTDEEGTISKVLYQQFALSMFQVTADQTLVEVPATATVEKCKYYYQTSAGTYAEEIDGIAFDGSDVYLHGLTTQADAWVKGTYAEGALIVPGGQYLGTSDKYVRYFRPAMYGGETDAVGNPIFDYCDAVFAYDKDAQTLTLQNGEQMCLLLETNSKYVTSTFTANMVITTTYPLDGGEVDTEVPTPSAPYSAYITASKNGYPILYFYLQPVGTKNQILDENKLYYQLYKDGEPYTISGTKYALVQDYEMFPYTFTDNWNFTHATGTGTFQYRYRCDIIDLTNNGYKTLGVKAIYVDGDVTNESDVVEVVNTGIQTISTTATDSRIYDLQGRSVKNAQKGIYIIGGKKVLK